MTIWVDVKYANLLSTKLRNYKHKDNYLWNFACPICGDSSKNKLKARGYIYRVKAGLFVKCHNCGYGSNLGNLIKHLDPSLYQEYVLENYKNDGAPHTPHKAVSIAIPDFFKQEPISLSENIGEDEVLSSLKRIDKLPDTHPAKIYVKQRKLPSDRYNLLYFTTKFKRYTNSIIPNKFKGEDYDHPRLIIPYFNGHGKCFAFQARAFGKETPKYITIKIDENQDRIYGLDRVDYSKRIYVTEGPLDSLFIPNSIAVSGSSYNSSTIEMLKSKATLVYDNERRSKEITTLIAKSIDQGFSVCLWPDTVTFKDINEGILAGYSAQNIKEIIDANTFSGPEGMLRFSAWKKC